MRVKLLGPFNSYRAGEVVDVIDETATVLLKMGWAVAVRSSGPSEVEMLETPETASARRPRGKQRGTLHNR